jgi:hypothetical protein
MTVVPTDVTVEEVTPELASDSIPNTRRWARDLHGSQKDKNGLPYVTHLDAVAYNYLAKWGFDREQIQACYLHDTLEDVKGLLQKHLEDQGFSEDTIYVVNVVTKRTAEPNYDYIRRVIKGGVKAMKVKLADMEHNTSEDRIAMQPTHTQKRLLEKYLSGIFRIENALINLGEMDAAERTVTFEQALDAVLTPTTSAPSSYTWWKRPFVSIWKGDLMRFPDSSEPEREWTILDRRVKQNGTYAFTLEGWDGDIVLSNESSYESRMVGSAVSSGTFHATWKKRLGLPAEWEKGDDVPKYLEGENVPEEVTEEPEKAEEVITS